MVATRRGSVVSVMPPVAKSKKTPAAKSTAKPQKKENYGLAKFFDKTGTNRTGEKTAKENRERRLVESPFKVEVPERIKLLKSLKKMIQKIVTGAEAKRCPSGRTTCAEKDKVKGPYLVSLSTVKKLAEIIRLTPYDGPTRGQRMLKLKKERVEANATRRKLIAKIVAKNMSLSDVKSLREPFSMLITGLDVDKLVKRKAAAAKGAMKGKKTKAIKKAAKEAGESQVFKNIGAKKSSRYSSTGTSSASSSVNSVSAY